MVLALSMSSVFISSGGITRRNPLPRRDARIAMLPNHARLVGDERKPTDAAIPRRVQHSSLFALVVLLIVLLTW